MASKVTPSAQYAITVRLEYPHEPGWIAKISTAIARAGGAIHAIDLVHIRDGTSLRDYSVECASTRQAQEILESIKRLEGVHVQSVSDNTFLAHLGGKLEVASKVQLKTRADLSMAYTPGVARVCLAIRDDPKTSFSLTIRKNCIAVVSDGSAVPYRMHIRGPSFVNVQALPHMLRGGLIADAVAVISSVDPIMGETDR